MTVYLFRKENFDGGILELSGFDELVGGGREGA